MSYGLQVWGEHGLMQIDADYANYVLVQSGVTTTGTVVIGANDIIFARPVGGVGYVANAFGGRPQNWAPANTYAPRARVGGWSAPWNHPCEYVVVRPASLVPASSETYGMRVWRATGEMVFDSGLPYFYPAGNAVLSLSSTQKHSAVLATSTRTRYVGLKELSVIPHDDPLASFVWEPRMQFLSNSQFQYWLSAPGWTGYGNEDPSPLPPNYLFRPAFGSISFLFAEA